MSAGISWCDLYPLGELQLGVLLAAGRLQLARLHQLRSLAPLLLGGLAGGVTAAR